MANIENKNGKVLWTDRMRLNYNDPILGGELNYSVKFADINNDGINEVFISNEYYSDPKENSNFGRVACFDNKKRLLWKYIFRDTVSSPTFKSSNIYNIDMVGMLNQNGKKVLYAVARNVYFYPSAIFELDTKTGKRIDSLKTLWNAGIITNALMGDFNKDGKIEIVSAAIHNGFQKSVLFSIDIDKLGGQTPAPANYRFFNKQRAKTSNFILLPKTDYNKLYFRYNMPHAGILTYDFTNDQFMLDVLEGYSDPTFYSDIFYMFDNHLNLKYLTCGDTFQMQRDSLVAHGKLKPPYTNTSAYFKLLRDQIKYWNGNKFLSIYDMKFNKRGESK